MPNKRRTAKLGKGASDIPDTIRTPSASGDAPVQRQPASTSPQRGAASRMKTLLGFEWSDVGSWSTLVKLLNSPRDPASIAVWRILFGFIMMIDIPQERGMAYADYRWGDVNECRFPLFNVLTPLPVDWMYLVYLVMFIGAVGIFLGAFYRLSCLLFCIPYWYIFFLDKTTWNNHSYLYGLISFQLFFMDGNRFWSVDGWLNPKIRNANIPLWNIAIIRFQIFIVYFYAGLKKLDADWIGGYSMEYLSKHWIFEPFRFLLTDEQIDYFIVHLGGLFLDLSAGFLLFFDATRPLGTFFSSSFHIMNSQIFSIGMFPYAMLASSTVFYSASWPRTFCTILPNCLKNRIPSVSFSNIPQPSASCIYASSKDNTKKSDASNKKVKSITASWRHNTALMGIILYVCVQLFLPYSHFITKGYNNWTNGLYGYSWDMMIHTWHTQHVKVKYIDGKTGEEGYLSPEYWTESNRWASHSDMTKQYATCIGHHLEKMGLSEPRLYMDVWKSMNGRFQQRMYNPTVDLIRADWSPFSATPWLMPLLTELSDWRTKLTEIEDQLDEELDITFVADFPGMYLENYISEDLGNTTIQVLSGKVMVELVERKRNITLEIGDRIQVPAGFFHNVHTVSKSPSCYMYMFVNTTEHAIIQEATDFLNAHQADVTDDDDATTPTSIDPKIFEGLNMSDAVKVRILERLSAKIERNEQASRSIAEKAHQFLEKKRLIFHRMIVKTAQALNHIFLGGESVVLPVRNDEDETVPGGPTTHQDHGEL